MLFRSERRVVNKDGKETHPPTGWRRFTEVASEGLDSLLNRLDTTPLPAAAKLTQLFELVDRYAKDAVKLETETSTKRPIYEFRRAATLWRQAANAAHDLDQSQRGARLDNEFLNAIQRAGLEIPDEIVALYRERAPAADRTDRSRRLVLDHNRRFASRLHTLIEAEAVATQEMYFRYSEEWKCRTIQKELMHLMTHKEDRKSVV